MTIHNLKTINPHFEGAWRRLKKFEVRRNDRDFQCGDLLLLEEYDEDAKKYSGRKILVKADYILNDPLYCKEGYIVMGVTELHRTSSVCYAEDCY